MEVQKQVAAEQFVLCDRAGEVRGLLGTGDNGEPALSLYDTNGQSRVMLIVHDGAASLSFFAADPTAEPVLVSKEDGSLDFRFPGSDLRTTARVLLAVTDDGLPTLIFRDAQGFHRVGLTLDAIGRILLHLSDRKGRLRATLGSSGSDSTLMLHDAAGQARVSIAVGPDGTPRVLLFDAIGKIVGKLPEKKEG